MDLDSIHTETRAFAISLFAPLAAIPAKILSSISVNGESVGSIISIGLGV